MEEKRVRLNIFIIPPKYSNPLCFKLNCFEGPAPVLHVCSLVGAQTTVPADVNKSRICAPYDKLRWKR